jgi:hypothetical protein
VLVVQNSARGKQSSRARSSRLSTLLFAQPETQFLIANDNPTRIVILSDQRESKGLPFQSLPLLIANLELEFRATIRKQTAEPKSNRKYFVIFYPEARRVHVSRLLFRPNLSATGHSSPATGFLIENARLELTVNSRKQSSLLISNRERNRVSQTAFMSEPLSSAPNLAIIDFPVRGHL